MTICTFAGPAIERPDAVAGAGNVWRALEGRHRARATAGRSAVGARVVRNTAHCLYWSWCALDIQQRWDVRGRSSTVIRNACEQNVNPYGASYVFNL